MKPISGTMACALRQIRLTRKPGGWGARRTMDALVVRGLVERDGLAWKITDAGREAEQRREAWRYRIVVEGGPLAGEIVTGHERKDVLEWLGAGADRVNYVLRERPSEAPKIVYSAKLEKFRGYYA